MLKLPIGLADSPSRPVSGGRGAHPSANRHTHAPIAGPASPENDKAPPLIPGPGLEECLD